MSLADGQTEGVAHEPPSMRNLQARIDLLRGRASFCRYPRRWRQSGVFSYTHLENEK